MTSTDPTAGRVRFANDRPANPRGRYVLLWLQMARRLRHNHALDYALRLADDLKKPLVIYEGLKLNYPWASARFHKFILDGTRDNAAEAGRLGINYWPFVARRDGDGRGLVRRLCEPACALVTDDYPQFIVPAQTRAVAATVAIAVHAVDANGVIPLSALGAPVSAAAHLRPRMHRLFAESWRNRSNPEPAFSATARKAVEPPFAPWEPPADIGAFVRDLGVDPSVPALPGQEGGSVAGRKLLENFVPAKLPRYAEERNLPDDPAANAASGLSWYLHYGHVSMDEVTAAALGDGWTPAEINPKTRNKDDFFRRDANVNSFLDEAITWRDVGFHWNHRRMLAADVRPCRTWQNPGELPGFNFRSFDFTPVGEAGTLAAVLPEWAKATLAKHAGDKRTHLYTLDQFENGATHDELWNAAQRQLVATGRIHNYLRMLWGKKVLQWSRTPEEAYQMLEHLNNKYAIDGRDPNSYTGILWCFGLFDRPWPPEREVFGSVRYMTSESTARKFKLDAYLRYVKRLPTIAEVRRGSPPAPRAVRKQGGLFGFSEPEA